MRELWKPVVGYEDCYAASDRGRVKRTAKLGSLSKDVLATRIKRGGYASFHLCKDGVRADRLAHRVVWGAFHGPIPNNLQINHKNGIKADNRLSNLELTTSSQNLTHAYRVLKIPARNNPIYGSRNGSSKLKESDIPEIIRLYLTGKYRQKDIGAKYGISQRMVSLITRREKWQHVNVATLQKLP